MNIHILGICGTFMGGIALLARELGHQVTGSDANVYPPMSEQLREQGITLHEGYGETQLQPAPDLVIIGNALSRGNPCVEYLLNQGIRYASGPQWLAESVLKDRHVLAVSGTHGKTTTASLLAFLLQAAGRAPGFLIGGVAADLGVSARLGESELFVVEADEYDTAFFDKRSKFIHYRPRTLIINNIEFDHADIFADIDAIHRQFHHLVRTVPGRGTILARAGDAGVAAVLEMGCWTPVQWLGAGADWHATPVQPDYSAFDLFREGRGAGRVRWGLIGRHNADNAVAAIAAAQCAGLPAEQACELAGSFRGPSRRLQRLAEINGTTVYDDFAHHPTAIRETLRALRDHVGEGRLIAVLEPRSNTMKRGVHGDALAASLDAADRVFLYRPPDLGWDPVAGMAALGLRCTVLPGVEAIVEAVHAERRPGDNVVIMSNGAFGGIQRLLLERLRQ